MFILFCLSIFFYYYHLLVPGFQIRHKVWLPTIEEWAGNSVKIIIFSKRFLFAIIGKSMICGRIFHCK